MANGQAPVQTSAVGPFFWRPRNTVEQRAQVGLTVSGSRIIRRKAVHGDGEQGPADEDIVCECADRAEPEVPVADVAAAANEKSDDRDGVGDVGEDDAGCDQTVIGLSMSVHVSSKKDDRL